MALPRRAAPSFVAPGHHGRGNRKRCLDDLSEAAEGLCALWHRRPKGLEVVIHVLPHLEVDLRPLPLGNAREGPDHVNQDLGAACLDIEWRQTSCTV